MIVHPINPTSGPVERDFGSILSVTHLPVEFYDSQKSLTSPAHKLFLIPEAAIVYYQGLSKGQVTSDPIPGIAIVTCQTKKEASSLYEEAVADLKTHPPAGLATKQNGRVEYKPFKGIGEDGTHLVVVLYNYSGG